MAYAPDRNHPFPLPKMDQRQGNGGGGNNNGMSPAFMPGQQGLLAMQLNKGFGGGFDHWSNMLGNMYSPMNTQPFNYGGGAWAGHGQQQQPTTQSTNPSLDAMPRDQWYTMVYPGAKLPDPRKGR